jgi:hypothetical protein
MRKWSVALLAVCLLASYAASPAHAFVGCSLFQDANWFGQEFKIGRYYSFAYVGNAFNDQASSASVPNGCRLWIWPEINFGGNPYIFPSGDYPYLPAGWNDIVSSAWCPCP